MIGSLYMQLQIGLYNCHTVSKIPKQLHNGKQIVVIPQKKH